MTRAYNLVSKSKDVSNSPISAAVLLGILDADGLEALATSSVGLVHGENSLAGATQLQDR